MNAIGCGESVEESWVVNGIKGSAKMEGDKDGGEALVNGVVDAIEG